MALTHQFSLIIEDEEKKRSTVKLHRNPADTIAGMQGRAAILAPIVDGLIFGKIVAVQAVVELDLPGGLRAVAAGNSDVEKGGRFLFNAANGKRGRVTLPTFNEAFVIPGTDLIDPANTAVDDLVLELVGQGWTESNGSDLVALHEAYEVYGGNRRRG